MKPEEARSRIQGLIRQKIIGILTDEQKQKLKELPESSQGQRKPGQGMGPVSGEETSFRLHCPWNYRWYFQ